MKPLLRVLLAASLATVTPAASAALNVLACEPEWAALARELGGADVAASSATTALQDVHHIEARLQQQGRTPGESSLAEMDGLWNEAKAIEAGKSAV